jgi:multiple sugar transport system substrate-binding protein
MTNLRRWSVLSAAIVLVAAACGPGTAPSASAPGASPSTPVGSPSGSAGSGTAGALEMWERSGGNMGMVQELVRAWNEANPDRPINITEVLHTEMVPKLAQAVASGEVPDLVGLDLIYGPQFSSAGSLVDITDAFADDPTLETASAGHIEVASWEDRLYGVPLYADVSVLFWNKDLYRAAGLDPEKPPASLQEIHEHAAAITGDGNYGYYLPGNCAGCNIFTFAPLIWATDPESKIEPTAPGDEAMVGDIAPVLEWARMMHKEGLIDPAAQAETGETFAQVFGSGKVGIMGTGNFNVALLQDQNPELDLGVTLLPGLNGGTASFAGGDIVVIPKGSTREADAIDFMKFILTDEAQVEIYAKALDLPTRSGFLDNPYYADNEDVRDTAAAIEVARTPFTLKFFELINSPQGPWLQMLQRVYYSDDPIDEVIADAKAEMERIINE